MIAPLEIKGKKTAQTIQESASKEPIPVTPIESAPKLIIEESEKCSGNQLWCAFKNPAGGGKQKTCSSLI